MLQDAIAVKQDELSSCIQRRNSKLRQLFRLTTKYGGNYSEDKERLFLEVNDLSEGRSFDIVTLPPFNFHVSRSHDFQLEKTPKLSQEPRPVSKPARHALPNSRSEEAAVLQIKQQGLSHVVGTGGAGEVVGQNDFSFDPGRQSLSQARETNTTDVFASELHEAPTDSNEGPSSTSQSEVTSLIAKESLAEISEVPPRSTNEAGISSQMPLDRILPVEATTPSAAKQVMSRRLQDQQVQHGPTTKEARQEGIQDTHLPPDQTKVQAQKSDTGGFIESDSTRSPPNELPQTSDHENEIHKLYTNDEDQEMDDRQSHDKGTLPSQMNIVKANTTYMGIPSTPDSQLRLEEAQALKGSQLISTLSQDVEKSGPSNQESTAAQSSESIQSIGHGGIEEQRSDDFTTPFNNAKPQSTMPSGEGIRHGSSPDMPTAGLREHTFPSMLGNHSSKDPTLSRRPPMRIDTTIPPASESMKILPGRKTASGATAPMTPSEAFKTKSGPPTSQVQSPPERMTTRVSSGALRHKSVSEILGETPRHSTFHNDKSSIERAASADEHALHTPKSAASTTLSDAAAFRQRLGRLDEKDRSKPTTVVFVRQPSSSGNRQVESTSNQGSDIDTSVAGPKDYLLPLFTAQAAVPSQAHPLHSVVSSAHKTLSTADHQTDFQESQDCRILSRIYQLQNSGRWSLRQHERSIEPSRPKAHWDVLLGQMQWMRTDFREERKWKLAAAKGLADSCAQWVASSALDRILLQIRVRSPADTSDLPVQYISTPELVASHEDDSSDITDFESSDLDASKRSAPARIFSLPPDMFVFGLDRTPVADKVLSELPLYQPSVKTQELALGREICGSEDEWRAPVIPFSKFIRGKMVTRDQGPARKRSRFDYTEDLEDSHAAEYPFDRDSDHEQDALGPARTNVALFRPENKHIRDRIHAGHAFRPPSAYAMPSQSFFETRQSSQWTQTEDDELRRLVREYAYNWSLISSCLSTPSLFSSGAERRTPWECFERWIGIEGLPAEMSKTQYFKHYHSRRQAAQRLHEGQYLAQQQHQGINSAQMPLRRRTAFPTTVDRRKSTKHLHLVDAMRKLAKKRETAVHKQQHVANLAAMRKQNEAHQPRKPMNTPQEFSRVKWEREKKQQEAAREYQRQVLQQRENAKNAQRQGQPNGAPNMTARGSTYPLQVSGSSPSVAPAVPNGTNQTAPMNQLRPVPALPRMSNSAQGIGSVSSHSQGVPQAPMQHQMGIQHRLPGATVSDNARIYHEASMISNEQRVLATQQHPMGNSTSPNMGRVTALPHHNSSLFGGIQGRSGSPSLNGAAPNGSSAYPHLGNPSQAQPLSNGTIPVINQIQNQVKARNPQASPEQIKAITTDTLTKYRESHQQALQAATGNPNASAVSHNASINGVKGTSYAQQQLMMNGANGRASMNSLEYAQMMRSQQSNQQSRSVSSGIHHARAVSRSATPQTHPGNAPSQSPRPSTAQMAGAQ